MDNTRIKQTHSFLLALVHSFLERVGLRHVFGSDAGLYGLVVFELFTFKTNALKHLKNNRVATTDNSLRAHGRLIIRVFHRVENIVESLVASDLSQIRAKSLLFEELVTRK